MNQTNTKPSKRVPSDWRPLADDVDKLTAQCPDVDLRLETEIFRDHEFRTARVDWDATWRNWIRREQKQIRRKTLGR